MALQTHRALDVIREAYRIEGTSEVWLQRVLRVMEPSLPPGILLALEVDLQTAGTKSEIVAGRAANAGNVGFLKSSHERAPDWVVQATYGSGRTWISLRESVPERYFESADWLEDLRTDGLGDMLAVVSKHDVPRMPACAFFSLAEKPAQASAMERRLWDRVAVHLGVAQSVRAGVHQSVDAVFSPSGTCHGATPAAVASLPELRRIVRQRDRALARVPDRDVESTLGFWNQLADGRWILIDRFDADGRRYIVARRNPQSDPLRRLSAKERQIAEHAAEGRTNEWIGLEHSLSPATVSEHLRNAERKLGVRSRMELLEVIGMSRSTSSGL